MTGGITLILVLALMGGLIAYLGDKLGSKIGKNGSGSLACVLMTPPCS